MVITAKQRIQQFWKWFRSRESAFLMQLEQGNTSTVKQEIDSQFHTLSLPLHCCVGVESPSNLAFLSLICNGDKTAQFTALFWKEHAPFALLNRWNFYTCKPAAKHPPVRFELGGKQYTCEDWTVLLGQNEQAKKFELQVYSSDFKQLSPAEQMMRTMLVLRETFGEAFTEIYIGSVQTLENKPEYIPEDVIFCTFSRFVSFIRTAPQKLGWPVCGEPTMVCYGYQVHKPAQKNCLREDILSGVIRNPRLLEEPTSTADIFRSCGGSYNFFYYDNPSMNSADLDEFRSRVAAQVERFLEDYDLGYLIGTAAGITYSYLDMMIFDPPAFSAVFQDLCNRFDADLYLRPFGKSGYLQ